MGNKLHPFNFQFDFTHNHRYIYMCVIEWLEEEMKHGPPRWPYRQNKKIRVK